MGLRFSEAGYEALLKDIFRRFPSVQSSGFTAGAYKPGLERMLEFEAALGHPSRCFRCVHVAGTNGKGSVSNMLASALSACGYRTGLFTSPHLVDFCERMRIAEEGLEWPVARMVPRKYVFDFLTEWLPWIEEHELSFFEITTGLAFKWFADSGVDWAVIEVGLGGRLDSTNVLEKPELSIVTTIGLDHCALLGDTLEKIASEKAGIFKAGVPALVGETQPETAPVFRAAAPSGLVFADAEEPGLWPLAKEFLPRMDLGAAVQEKNLRTVLCALEMLALPGGGKCGEAVLEAIAHTARRMDFRGRWERLCGRPEVIADIGHNPQALGWNFAQLRGLGRPLRIVYGVMADKDLDGIIPLMPLGAEYFFATPSTPRALPSEEILRRFLAARPEACALAFDNVRDAVAAAMKGVTEHHIIYIGGSTFVVSDALPLFD